MRQLLGVVAGVGDGPERPPSLEAAGMAVHEEARMAVPGLPGEGEERGMRIVASVCDLCSKPGKIECRISVEGSSEGWDVCTRCHDKPFRRPTKETRAEAKMAMANLLHGMADGLRATA